MTRHFFTDTANATLEYVGDTVGVDATDDFDTSEAETTTLDTPWNDFFGTDEYVQFEATVAQPIVQPYFYDGELHYFRKTTDELKRARAQIDNLPWTTGHPENKRVEHADQIKGFWREPEYDDGQQATLNIPSNDTDSIRFAVENDNVSVGFSGRLDWEDDSPDVDATQRDMAYDHIASVENGRCSRDEGCGLHVETDSLPTSPTDGDVPSASLEQHGHVFQHVDGTRTSITEEGEVSTTTQWDEGDYVVVTIDGETTHGKIAHVDGERALVHEYDTETEEFRDETVGVATSELREWVGPYVDSCPGDDCSCGCHDSDSQSRGYRESSTTTHDCHLTNDSASTANQSTKHTTMTDLQELFNDNDITKEQVIDHYGIEQKESPQDFYDGEPDIENIADDFPTVQMLLDTKEELEDEVAELNDELRETKRPVFEEKVDELVSVADDAFGSKGELMEAFDAEDEDERLTVDEIEEKIDRAKTIRGTESTGPTADSGSEGNSQSEIEAERTRRGKIKLGDPR